MDPQEIARQLGGMTGVQLRATLADIDAELTRLHVDERGELRQLDQVEQARFDELIDLRAKVTQHAEIRAAYDRHPGGVERAFAGPALQGGSVPGLDELDRMTPGQVRDAGLRLLEQRGRDLDAGKADQMDRLLRQAVSTSQPHMDGSLLARRLLISESDAYRSAFAQIMQQQFPILTAEEAAAVRALQRMDALEARAMGEGSGPVGAYGLPVLIDPSIMLSSGAGAAPIMDVARVVPTNTNVWKGVSSAPPSWSWDAEASAVSDDSPTLAQPSITIYTARGFLPYSLELGMDYPDFAAEMQALLEQGYLDIMASTTATGSGSSQPFGVFTKLDATTTSEIVLSTNSAAGGFNAAAVFNVWNNLPERFRSRASWIMSVSVESQIRSFATTTAGQASSYFTVDLTADGLSRVNGRPTVVTDYSPAYNSTTGHANFLAVGDWRSAYTVAKRMTGMAIEPIQHLFDTTTGRPLGQRGFFAYSRAGADVVVTNAARLLNQT